jgi:PAS domain S-box-containing protein
MVWSTLPDGFHDYYNARWYEFTGVPVGSTDGEAWNGMFHPDDQELAWTKWRHSLATGEPYEIEYRLRHSSGEYRWTLGRSLPMRNERGEIVRWFGTCTDIHEQRMLMDQREMVSQELSHRIKNIFAVIGGLVSLHSAAYPEMKGAARDLRSRITALGAAHDFVRPHSAKSKPTVEQTSLIGLLKTLMAPYTSGNPRVTVRGADIRIDDRSATPIALVFHELATNAAKYGALANADGTVEILIEDNGENVSLHWRERGGLPVADAPVSEGFGSRLIELSIKNQLRGQILRDWSATGLRVTVVLPKSSMSRSYLEAD